MLHRTLPLSGPLDLGLTLAPLRHGLGDPTIRLEKGRLWRATRTPEGPATTQITIEGAAVRVVAWGPGTEWALEHAPALLGVDDDPEAFRPAHRVLNELARRMRGLRIGRTAAVMEALLPAIIEQKVTGEEARRAYRRLLRVHGERAPGPAPGPAPLIVPPEPSVLAGLPYHAYHPLGLERRRADTIRRAAAHAVRIEEASRLPLEEAYRRLMALPGVGAWTAAEVARTALGDPDAVSVGDYHLPNLVSWALAGEPRGDDARMLELLAPYRGQRGRVVRMLEASGIRPPRFGPRLAPRSFEAI
jgi:3-methyladenine DNA glycosylase/8-oxoguanine DNA glycosylase